MQNQEIMLILIQVLKIKLVGDLVGFLMLNLIKSKLFIVI